MPRAPKFGGSAPAIGRNVSGFFCQAHGTRLADVTVRPAESRGGGSETQESHAATLSSRDPVEPADSPRTAQQPSPSTPPPPHPHPTPESAVRTCPPLIFHEAGDLRASQHHRSPQQPQVVRDRQRQTWQPTQRTSGRDVTELLSTT